MTQQNRLITYIIIVAVVSAIAWFGSPNNTFTPRGVLLPASEQKYAAISPDDVIISANLGITGIHVGTINIEAYTTNNSQQTMLSAEHYAAELAAQHGANHVIITMAAINPNAKILVLRAKALRTNKT